MYRLMWQCMPTCQMKKTAVYGRTVEMFNPWSSDHHHGDGWVLFSNSSGPKICMSRLTIKTQVYENICSNLRCQQIVLDFWEWEFFIKNGFPSQRRAKTPLIRDLWSVSSSLTECHLQTSVRWCWLFCGVSAIVQKPPDGTVPKALLDLWPRWVISSRCFQKYIKNCLSADVLMPWWL